MKNQSVHVRRSVMCALYAALLAVSAWIQIPAAIPFTLQTAAVCIAAALSGGAAAMAVTLYLALGAIGLPIFSNFNSGWAALIGPTAGYLWGLFLIVLTVSVGKRCLGNGRWTTIGSMAIGVALCYLAGILWYAVVYTAEPMSLQQIMTVCVLPFLLPEIGKIALAFAITKRLRKTNLIKFQTIN